MGRVWNSSFMQLTEPSLIDKEACSKDSIVPVIQVRKDSKFFRPNYAKLLSAIRVPSMFLRFSSFSTNQSL